MKKIKTAFVVSAATIVAGCASQVPQNLDCSDGPVRRVNINYVKNSEIRVSPGTRTAKPGDVIEFKLKGVAETEVEISGGSAASAWVKGKKDGSPSGTFVYVCVAENQADDDYKYDVAVEDIGNLDPVVRVRR